ncbi:MAG: hypothetical protein AAFN92_12345, partial [Bacteroidota bacterium]
RGRLRSRQLAYYDTTPTATTGFVGVWGAYPWLPSGNILASDMATGLYVVEVEDFDIALPVAYEEWTAAAAGKNVSLEWTTASETDNAGWTVEHAGADGTFTSLGFVPSGTGAYSFVHLTPGSGTHFYRLRQRDLDGAESFSPVRSVTFGGAGERSLRPYPNPAPAAAAVNLGGLSVDDDWTVTDLQGRTLLRGKGNLLTANLNPGLYVLRAGDQASRLVIH